MGRDNRRSTPETTKKKRILLGCHSSKIHPLYITHGVLDGEDAYLAVFTVFRLISVFTGAVATVFRTVLREEWVLFYFIVLEMNIDINDCVGQNV